MDPYEVLGVTRDATMAEIEARYRLLLREYHPDVHHHQGPEAVAHAEATTRNLNTAIGQLRRASGRTTGGGPASRTTWGADGAAAPTAEPRARSQWAGDNPFWRPPEDRGPTHPRGATYYSPHDVQWFGTPVDHAPDEPVPCPFCGRPYDRLDDYEYHLEQVHKFRRVAPRPPRRKSRLVRAVGSLRFIPLWLVVPIAFANWRMFGFEWFTVSLVVVLIVMWTQTSRMFRDY